jgi:hypothetical protein
VHRYFGIPRTIAIFVIGISPIAVIVSASLFLVVNVWETYECANFTGSAALIGHIHNSGFSSDSSQLGSASHRFLASRLALSSLWSDSAI